jgi:predicted DNA-binding transcriptional regulator AlpA
VKDHLTIPDVAAVAGVKPKTIGAYMARGQMPPPDGRLGRTPWWRPDTIKHWLANRPGRGARTDKHTTEEKT